MQQYRFSYVLLLVLGWASHACIEYTEKPPVSTEEQLLVSLTWKPEGVYVNSIKQPNTRPFTIRFFPKVADNKAVVINGIPGGTWSLDSSTKPHQLTIYYPDDNFSIGNASPVLTSEITLNVNSLSANSLNLSASNTSSFYGIITLSPTTELRLIPN